MEKRVCKACGIEKGITKFTKSKYKKKIYRNYTCKKCIGIRKTERRHALAEWLIDYKSGLVCKECGESRWYILDFHHRDPSTKLRDVCIMVTHLYSKKMILKEIAKCDVLCANCHREQRHKEKMACSGVFVTG